MEEKKTETFTVRLDGALQDRIAKMEKALGFPKSTIFRACLEALLVHFEAHGKISFPIRITDEPEKPDAFARKK